MKEPPHTLSTFDDALDDLLTRASLMGGHVKGMIAACTPTFLNHDTVAAANLIQSDLETDKQKDGLILLTMETLARHQPMASDLRLVLAIEHIASDLERIGDHAKNIAKRTLSLTDQNILEPSTSDLMMKLHAAVSGMFEDSLAAFIGRDEELAAEVRRRDQVPDAIYDDLFHALIARIQSNPSEAPADVQALFVAKSLERIGDHATNIADEARFIARGDVPSATRLR